MAPPSEGHAGTELLGCGAGGYDTVLVAVHSELILTVVVGAGGGYRGDHGSGVRVVAVGWKVKAQRWRTGRGWGGTVVVNRVEEGRRKAGGRTRGTFIHSWLIHTCIISATTDARVSRKPHPREGSSKAMMNYQANTIKTYSRYLLTNSC